MKTIELKSLTLHNFKGLKDVKVEFFTPFTTISGANATGKSTIFDAYTWLLFGKDSLDRKDYEIKTLLPNGQPKRQLDHSVEGVFSVSTEGTITLKRVYREKWVTKRGSDVSEFTGHETLYFWNEVPMQQGEFESKVSEIIPESTFKLISNPYYFNNVLKWKDRRDLLIEMAGGISLLDIAAGDKDFLNLVEIMNASKKTLDDLKKEYAAKKKLIVKALEEIPSRIDEAERSKPEPVDVKATQKRIKELETEIEALDNKAKALESDNLKYQELNDEISQVREVLRGIEADANKVVNEEKRTHESLLDGHRGELRRAISKRDNSEIEASELRQNIARRDRKIEDLRAEWVKVNESHIHLTDNDTKCPTCLREYDNVDEIRFDLESNHKKYKDETLATLSNQGKGLKQANEKDKESLETLLAEIETLKQVILDANGAIGKAMEKTFPTVSKLLSENKLFMEYAHNLKTLEAKIQEPVKRSDNKPELVAELDTLKASLATSGAIAKADARIKELEAEGRSLSQQKADLERDEYTIERFTRKHVESVEKKVNARFLNVNFKLFDTQINGGIKETCETLINGVPYPSANHAAQINAGLDIISTFSGHYKVVAPVFIDNAEAVNTLMNTNGQMIPLYVTTDKVLTIKNS